MNKIPIEIKSCENGKSTRIKGYASIFNFIDSHGDIISKDAFTDTMKKPLNEIKFLWQHDIKNPIGLIEKIYVDDYGLLIEAQVTLGTRAGQEASDLLQKGIIDGLSIGFNVIDSGYNEKGQRIINKLDLWEISLVTFPANSQARILHNKQQEITHINEEKMNNLLEVAMPSETIHQDNFIDFIKGGSSPSHTKSFSQDQQEFGGYAVVSDRFNNIISMMSVISPMRQIADSQTISTNALDLLIQNGEFESGWVSERQQRPDTEGSKILQKRILVHEIYAQPKATQRLLDDSYVNIEQWITEQLVNSFAAKENAAFINGDGANKPRGILTYDEIEKVQVETQGQISLTDIINLMNSLNEQYQSNCSFLMNRRVFAGLQSIKDENNRFIIQSNVSERAPSTLFGIPIYLSSDMPLAAEGSCAIAIGDFKQAYKIVDRHGISVMKDPFTEKPYTKFYATKRVGGDVVNIEAIKLLKL
ncbi:MAG: phage major capsid protein [Rickettsiaceae bacterium]|nr:phage major capsid protein [Rickettsiaceae bacterium]